MASKKTPEKIFRPSTMTDLLPGQIEEGFRKHLGAHNLHLNLLELSALSFEAALSQQANPKTYIREQAKKNRLFRLYPENSSFADAHKYLFVAHIAYVFSSGDALCKKIRSNSYIRHIKDSNIELFNLINIGASFQKTISIVSLASLPSKGRSVEAVRRKTQETLQVPCFSLLNYYRLIRNEELHSAESEDKRLEEAWGELNFQQIEREYGLRPNKLENLGAIDALLCSKVWQDSAKWLCRHMLNDVEVAQPMLRARFGNLSVVRRLTGAKNFMKQSLLYSDADIDVMLAELKWCQSAT